MKRLLAAIGLILALIAPAFAQTVPLGPRFVLPYQTVVDSTGVPIPGALLNFYISGTNTRLATYSDPLLTVPNSNPVVANAAGVFPNIFLNGNYKIILTDGASPPNQIWTADPVLGQNIAFPSLTLANGMPPTGGLGFESNTGTLDALLYETVGNNFVVQTGQTGLFGVTDGNQNFLFTIGGAIPQAKGGTTNGTAETLVSLVCAVGDENWTVSGTPSLDVGSSVGWNYKVGSTTAQVRYTIQAGDTLNSVAAGITTASRTNATLATLINGTCPNGNYWNGVATSVQEGNGGGVDVISTADPTLSGNGFTAVSSSNVTVTTAPVGYYFGGPQVNIESGVPGRDSIVGDVIYSGQVTYPNSSGVFAAYQINVYSVVNAAVPSMSTEWSTGGGGFQWQVAGGVSSFSAINEDLDLIANSSTTNNVALTSGSAGHVAFGPGSGGTTNTLASAATSGSLAAFSNALTLNQAGASSQTVNAASNAVTLSANQNQTGVASAVSNSVTNSGTGTVNTANAAVNSIANSGTGTITTARVNRSLITNNGGGTITTATGFQIGTPVGPATAVASTWTNITGLEITNQNPSSSGGGSNTLTNPPVALSILSQTASGAYAIQQSGSGLNSFAGASTFSGGLTITLGSDATGDLYYRSSGGGLARLPVCTGTNVVGASGGLPACVNQTGGLGGALTYLCTITASSSASITSLSPTSGTCTMNNTYTSYMLVFQNIVPATDEKILELQVYSGSYRTSGYNYSMTVAANGTNTSPGAGGVNYFPLSEPLDTNASSLHNAAPGFSGTVTFTNPSANAIMSITSLFGYNGGGGSAYYVTDNASGIWATAGVVTGFQVLMDSGNLASGSILVYGIT